MTPREIGQRARGLVLLAQTDSETKRDAFEDTSVGDGSIRCAVCEEVQPKGRPYVWVWVSLPAGKAAMGGRAVCLPCIGACVGAERPA
jgi:hypothetical protein